MYNKPIIAVIASAKAVKIEFEIFDAGAILDTTWSGLKTGWGATKNWGENFGTNFVGSFDFLGPYTDGDYYKNGHFFNDLSYFGSKDFGVDLGDSFLYILDGDRGLKDLYTWASEDNGKNWLAFGKTAAKTSHDILKGDFGGAWDRFFDSDNHDYQEGDEEFFGSISTLSAEEQN